MTGVSVVENRSRSLQYITVKLIFIFSQSFQNNFLFVLVCNARFPFAVTSKTRMSHFWIGKNKSQPCSAYSIIHSR